MKIIQIAPECAPALKAGGLADVVFGLSRALIQAHHEVRVVVPDHLHGVNPKKGRQIGQFPVFFEDRFIEVRIREVPIDGIVLWMISTPSETDQFFREKIYGYEDDALRYAFFCRASLSLLLHLRQAPDVVHVHDWATSLVPVLYRELFQDLGLQIQGFCLTLHNLESQGVVPAQLLKKVGLDPSWLCHPSRLEDPSKKGWVNLLKGGIVFSDALTTVSPTYAEEVLSSLSGRGLEKVLAEYQGKLTGILNGLDFDYWNPETDPLIPIHFGISKPQEIESSRREIKEKLQKRLELKKSERPLVMTVSRLVPQKGMDLLQHAILRTLQMGGEYVLLGSSPIPEIQESFWRLKMRLASSGSAHLHLVPDEELTHWMYAGADFTLIPSIFEPCGLTQMIGLRYGALPIVRETGGLKDSVWDIEYGQVPLSQRNGWTFQHADQNAIDWVLNRIFDLYDHRPSELVSLRLRGMQEDHSWKHPMEEYVKVYKGIAQ